MERHIKTTTTTDEEKKEGKSREPKRENGNEVECAMLERAPEYEMMMICMPASVFNESQNHFQSSGSVQASGCLREKFSVLLLPRQSGSSRNCFYCCCCYDHGVADC